jgi:hypothetical protein
MSQFHTLPAFSFDAVIKGIRTWLETAHIPTRGTTSWHFLPFRFPSQIFVGKKCDFDLYSKNLEESFDC